MYLAWSDYDVPEELGAVIPRTPEQFRKSIGDDGEMALQALLATERQSFTWGLPQRRMVARAAELVSRHDELLIPPLVLALAKELDGPPDRGEDSRLMCLLDVTAQVAARRQMLFAKEARKHPFLADRLAVTAVRHNAFPGRCAAVTLLGFLREPIRGNAAQAIAATLRDVWHVQSGALTTSERFITVTDELRAILVKDLTGESALAAYAAARMLVNYGAANGTRPEVRQDILEKLAAAAAHPSTEKDVFQLDENTDIDRWCIQHLGRLRDLLYQGMLTVAGLA
jgi:hypothetical protein